MGRMCLICNSPFRAEIDELYTSQKFRTIADLYRDLKRKYGDKFNYTYERVRRHLQYDVKMYIEEGIKSDKIRKRKIEEEALKTMEAAQILRENLESLNTQMQQLSEQTQDKNVRKEIRDIIGKSNQVLELILKYYDKMKEGPSGTEEELFNKIIHCMVKCDFPVDLVIKFREEWKNVS